MHHIDGQLPAAKGQSAFLSLSLSAQKQALGLSRPAGSTEAGEVAPGGELRARKRCPIRALRAAGKGERASTMTTVGAARGNRTTGGASSC